MLESGHAVKIRHGPFDTGAIAIFFCKGFIFLLLPTPGKTKGLGIIAE